VVDDDGGAASAHKFTENKNYWALFEPFSEHLPDMDFVISIFDNPVAYVSWEERERHLEAAQRGQCT
jgi:hypothetical protein